MEVIFTIMPYRSLYHNFYYSKLISEDFGITEYLSSASNNDDPHDALLDYYDTALDYIESMNDDLDDNEVN